MDTQDATSGTTVPFDDADRRAWFAKAGHSGNLHEQAALCGRNGEPCGTVAVADVWCVRRGLIALQKDHPKLFHRIGNWADMNRRPADTDNLLSGVQYGPLTHPQTGEWLPGRRELVVILLEPEPEDDVFYRLREQPLIVENKEIAEAA